MGIKLTHFALDDSESDQKRGEYTSEKRMLRGGSHGILNCKTLHYSNPSERP